MNDSNRYASFFSLEKNIEITEPQRKKKFQKIQYRTDFEIKVRENIFAMGKKRIVYEISF